MDLTALPLAVLGAAAVPDWVSTLSDLVITDQPSSVAPLILPGALEYAALITGSISGSLMAGERDLDIVGATALAMVTGLGGGLMRDVILPTTSVYMLDHPVAIVLCLAIGMMAFFFRGIFTRMNTLVTWVDILSVALFAGAGAEKAQDAGYGFLPCVFLGVITAVGGGMLRDVCLREVPVIFRRGTYYAIAALAGAATYVLLCNLHVVKPLAMVACITVTVTLRALSVHYNLQSMTSVDLTPHVTRPLREAWQSVQRSRAERARVSVHHRLVVDEQVVAPSTYAPDPAPQVAAGAAASGGRADEETAARGDGACATPDSCGDAAAGQCGAPQHDAGQPTCAAQADATCAEVGAGTANTPGAGCAACGPDVAGSPNTAGSLVVPAAPGAPSASDEARAPGQRYVRKPGLPLRPGRPHEDGSPHPR